MVHAEQTDRQKKATPLKLKKPVKIKVAWGEWFSHTEGKFSKDHFISLGKRVISPGTVIVQRKNRKMEMQEYISLDGIIKQFKKFSAIITFTRSRGDEKGGISSRTLELQVGSTYCFGKYKLTIEKLGSKSASINVSK